MTTRTDTIEHWVSEDEKSILPLSGGHFAKISENIDHSSLEVYAPDQDLLGWCPLKSTTPAARFFEAAHIIEFLLLRGKGPVEIGHFLNETHILWPRGQK